MKKQSIKEMVKQKYSEIALKGEEEHSSCCCGTGKHSMEIYHLMREDYSKKEGYHSDADLGLGCGLPTQYAGIRKGDVVLDLGSGAGNDCFVARAEVGDAGKVIGIDFSEAMVEKARQNAKRMQYENVFFQLGDIEEMPVDENTIDVVISNCVLNLLPDKSRIFHEMYRVLKPGGHFCISDIVLEGELPDSLKSVAAFYIGCVAGAIQKEEYIKGIYRAGFEKVEIRSEKQIVIPEELLSKHLTPSEVEEFKTNQSGIFSITVTGIKLKGCTCGSAE